MGLLDCSSQKARFRGYGYFTEGKVTSCKQTGDSKFSAIVNGSDRNSYQTTVDVTHPRSSKCTCPFVEGNTKICKHMVAVYLTVFPNEADRIKSEIISYEAEQKIIREQQEEFERDCEYGLPEYIHNMRRNKLEEALLELLYDGPEWQLEAFIDEHLHGRNSYRVNFDEDDF